MNGVFPVGDSGGVVVNGGSIVMGAHWNTQNTSKYTCILMCFDVF